MARQYYYLVAGFPELSLDVEQRAFDHPFLKEQIESALHAADLPLWRTMYLSYDNQNLINALIKKHEFNTLGNFSKDEIEEAIEQNRTDALPIYMQNFLQQIKEQKESKNELLLTPLRLEMQMNTSFYEHIEALNNSFLLSWFTLDRSLRNFFVAITSRKLKKEMVDLLVGDDEVTHSLTKNMSADFGLKGNIEGLDNLLQISDTKNIVQKELKFDAFKFKMLEELTIFNYFSIEKVLSFAVKMQLIERWAKLDSVLGKQKLKTILSNILQSFDLQKSESEV
ncbi:MAG: DUF2764 family protein [Bacteroidales bacterium]